MSTDFDLDIEPEPCRYPDYEERATRSFDDLPATGEHAEGVERAVWDALYEIQDPEMPVSIVDLGLIYDVTVEDGEATVEMTLTYTGCPAREMLVADIERAPEGVEGVEEATVHLVFTPEWSIDMVTEQGRDDLREFGLSI